MILLPAPLRLRLDKAALVSNWNWLNQRSGNAACGAAIKANGYGTDAPGVMRQLAAAGCRDFFVANWAEALALSPLARSEEHTSELQSLMRISYAVFCLKKKKTNHNIHN